MEASAPSSNIPTEIIGVILLQLPVKSIIRFQCVCKHWRSLIQDSDFKLSYSGQGRLIILSHQFKRVGSQNSRIRFTTRHDFRLEREKWSLGEADEACPLIRGGDQNPVRALCSCNGFVLLRTAEGDSFLWNPSTRCSTKVVESPPFWGIKNLVDLAGLCYDSCTRDFKVVSLRKYDGFYGFSYAVSTSLNHKEWKPIQFPYNIHSVMGSVEFCNTFHWWVSEKDRYYLHRNMIIYFDPVHDEFKILPTPSEQRENNLIVGLGVIDNCLSMACIDHHNEEETNMIQVIQVFIMKEYGRQESWMTVFAIQLPQLTGTYGRYGLTFYSQKNNTQEDVLFMHRCSDRQHVYVYDRKKDEMKEVLMDFLKQNSGYFDSMCFYMY